MQRRQLALATVGFAISFAVWGLISALAPYFKGKDVYNLSQTENAMMVAIPVILGALFRIPIGYLADRFGGRRVFSALLAFAIVPAAGIALMHSYGALLFWGFFLGIAGSSFAVGVAFSSRWFSPAQQGMALGIFGMGNIGQSVAVFGAPVLREHIGWEAVFWIFGGISVLWAGVFWLFGRDAGERSPIPLRHVVDVFIHQRLTWLLAFFYFITFGGFVAMGVYLPTLLKTEFGLDAYDAGLKTAGFVVLATLIRPVGGWLSDRLGGARVLSLALVVIVAMALLLTSSDFTVFSVGALGAAAMLGLGNGAVFRLVPQSFPREIGAVTGLVGALGGLGGFFPPIVLGLLKDQTGSYALGFVFLAVFAAIALALAVFVLIRPGHRNSRARALPA